MTSRKTLFTVTALLIVLFAIGFAVLKSDSKAAHSIKREAMLQAARVAGGIAEQVMDRASDLHNVPVEVVKINDFIFQARGVANAFLISTSEGNVLFDSGLVIQASKQRDLLLDLVLQQPLTHLIVSHSHGDHAGGVRIWKERETKIITHREFIEEQRYLTELQPFLWKRNRTLFPFIPEEPPTGMMAYGGITPDIIVENYGVYKFELGGVEFEVYSTPGAEGADNISLWLPQHKILFSGDALGPMFPQFPNLFTMRGEKVRKPIEYISTLNFYMELAPKILIPSHFNAHHDSEKIQSGLRRIRDAVQYVHDETVAGMNQGRSVYQLMEEIQLPQGLEITQGHGRVSWAVKTIWEYYTTWFHWDSASELYSVPQSAIHSDLVSLAGEDSLLEKSSSYLKQGQALHALHLVEIVLNNTPQLRSALILQRDILQRLMLSAKNGLNNTYEVMWLQRQIEGINKQLDGH